MFVSPCVCGCVVRSSGTVTDDEGTVVGGMTFFESVSGKKMHIITASPDYLITE